MKLSGAGPSLARVLVIPGERYRVDAKFGGRLVEVLGIEDDGERIRVREIVGCTHLVAKLLAPGEPCSLCAVRVQDPPFQITLVWSKTRDGWTLPRWYERVEP